MKKNKWGLRFYIIAALTVMIPIIIVLFTDYTFSAFYSKIIMNTAITFVIIGKTIAVFKAVENRKIPWTHIGAITGLVIVLLWGILR